MTTGELCIFPYVPTLSVVSQYLGLLEKSFQPAWNFFMPEFTLAHRLKECVVSPSPRQQSQAAARNVPLLGLLGTVLELLGLLGDVLANLTGRGLGLIIKVLSLLVGLAVGGVSLERETELR